VIIGEGTLTVHNEKGLGIAADLSGPAVFRASRWKPEGARNPRSFSLRVALPIFE